MLPPTAPRSEINLQDLPPGAARHEPPIAAAARVHGEGTLADAVRDAALALGFARVGFCPIEPFTDAARALDDWLARGHHGEMAFMVGSERAEPGALLPRARTVIVVAMAYDRGAGPRRVEADALLPTSALLARYARGRDYHGVMKERLRMLADRCAELTGRSVVARACVDTAPLLEREAARRAGVGFTAKNTMIIAPGLGSYVVLGELLVDLELTPSTPVASGCGSCRSCLDACPTGAFVDAYTLDARRCISYLTIELRGSIPRALRPAIGRWVFGCDVCQEVCPFNQSSRPRPFEPSLGARAIANDLDLVELLQLTSSGYRRLVKKRALARANRVTLQRNAAVALGNARAASAVPALTEALRSNPSALVREHVAWALGQIGTEEARRALAGAFEQETEPSVIAEIALASAELP